MSDLQINPRFKDLLPPLSDAEITQLEASLKEEGCREPILVWRNQIIDGHNRYALCEINDLSCRIQEMAFADEDEALEWILVNQLGRRNLSENQKTFYIGELQELQKKRVGNPELQEKPVNSNDEPVSSLENDLTVEIDPQFQKKPARTAEKLGKQFGVTARTVQKAAAVVRALDSLPAETKTDFLAGKVTQKAVIQKAKEVTEPVEDPFVKMCHEWGLKIQLAIAKVEGISEEMSQAFKTSGQFDTLQPFIQRLGNLRPGVLKDEKLDAYVLKQIVQCPNCSAKGCDHCKKGYLTGDDAKSLTKHLDYKAKGGKNYTELIAEREAA